MGFCPGYYVLRSLEPTTPTHFDVDVNNRNIASSVAMTVAVSVTLRFVVRVWVANKTV